MKCANKIIIKLRYVPAFLFLMALCGCKPSLEVEVYDSISNKNGNHSLSIFEGDSAFIQWNANSTQLATLQGVSISPDIGYVEDSGELEITDITKSIEYTITAQAKSPNIKTLKIHALTPYCAGTDNLTNQDYRVGLEIIEPANTQDNAGPFPAVVIIHGGSFSQGDMIEMAAYANEASRRNYIAANINYRLIPSDNNSAPYSWPSGLQDVKCAIRYLRENAVQLNLDVNSIGVIGHSAGGFLATMAALTGNANEPIFDDIGWNQGIDDSVSALVSVAGPMDLMDSYGYLSSKVMLDPEYLLIQNTLLDSLKRIFTEMGLDQSGIAPKEDRLDPNYTPYSPYTYIKDNAFGNLDLPIMFIYGEADYAIPAQHGCDFINELEKTALQENLTPQAILRQYTGPSSSHIAFIEPLKDGLVESLSNYGKLLDQTLQDSFDFFDVYLKGAPRTTLPEGTGCTVEDEPQA